MKLIDLLVQELPKRGGWPVKAKHAWCDRDGEIRFRGDATRSDFYPKPGTVDYEQRIPNVSHEDDHDFIITREQYEDALAASKHTEWSGEGTPPVGHIIEVNSRHFGWIESEVVAVTRCYLITRHVGKKGIESLIVHTEIDDVGVETTLEPAKRPFRPIRTEAERKREEAVGDLTETIIYFYGNPKGAESYKALAERVIEAISIGKIPSIRLE